MWRNGLRMMVSHKQYMPAEGRVRVNGSRNTHFCKLGTNMSHSNHMRNIYYQGLSLASLTSLPLKTNVEFFSK